MLAIVFLALIFPHKIFISLSAEINGVHVLENADMIDVGVSQDHDFFSRVKIGKLLFQDSKRLGTIARKATVDEKKPVGCVENGNVASAGRSDHDGTKPVFKGDFLHLTPIVFTLVPTHGFGEFSDIVKGFVRRTVLFGDSFEPRISGRNGHDHVL